MLPAYNPENFGNIDLRKYHVREIKDVLRFIEFTVARLDESKHIINKFATRANTLEAVVKQMQAQQQKLSNMYGAPSGNVPTTSANVEDKEKAVIQTAEEKSAEQEKANLLDDLRQAAANETVAAIADDEDKLVAEFEKYKAVQGKNRVMFYREGKMVSAKDVPEDIKVKLEAVFDDGQGENGQDE